MSLHDSAHAQFYLTLFPICKDSNHSIVGKVQRYQNSELQKLKNNLRVKDLEDNEAKEASMSSIDNSSMEDKEAMEASKTFNQEDLFKALEVVERDSLAIAESYTSLFASLRLALSEITNTSVDHIQCFSDAAGKVQESAIDAATRGNRFIHSCIRLNDEMKGIDDLAAHLKILKRNVDALDSAASRLLRIT